MTPTAASAPKLCAVVAVRNEEANIRACLDAFAQFRGEVETVVVDNSSTDATKRIAAECGARVLDTGPERSAQRNLGWRAARADLVVILDADMIVPPETVREMLSKADGDAETFAWWIPETRAGRGFRAKARNFERSFYDGTCIDALRLFRRPVLEATGGYDENLIAGPEDWDLDIRILATGAKCEVLRNGLFHNEKQLSFGRMLAKKAYYSKSMGAYRAKWPGHPAVRRQFSPFYRLFGVFFEKGKWRKVARHPLLWLAALFDRLAVGLVYLANRGGPKSAKCGKLEKEERK